MKKFFPYLAFSLFLLIAVFASLNLVLQKNVTLFSRATTDKPQIWILPTKIEGEKDKVYTLKILLDTNNQEISGVDLVLKYDNQIIEVVDNNIKPGVIFDYYRDKLVDNRKGIIKLSSQGKFKGQGTFATLEIKGKSSGEGKLEVVTPKISLDSTIIWDSQGKENILGPTQGLVVRFY
ncbi:MAG: cohesin domain-containing protein [Microgenomates group bacterium]